MTVLVSGDAVWALSVAAAWQGDGDAVTVVLLDGAAALARAGHVDGAALAAAQAAGVIVAAHDEALRRRALPPGGRAPEVQVVGLDEVADLVTSGADKAVWL